MFSTFVLKECVMVKMTSISIWTEADRLCERCAAQVARTDDWLCQGCRSTIETHWLHLTTNNHYGYLNLAPYNQVNSINNNGIKLFSHVCMKRK